MVVPRAAAAAAAAAAALSLCLGSLPAHSEAELAPGDSPLIAELLRRTEANREANDAVVRRKTDLNAYTALEGAPNMPTLVLTPEGRTAFYDEGAVARMTREGRMRRGVGAPPRIVELSAPMNVELPVPRVLGCAADGNSCGFREK